ncbi:hypothetical protein [Candidatus Enterococcus lemimoniae]|uniref:Cysteine-rich CPCC domain-containing protein n=1 Tax=Candidatus Enterococcus lemimoniae TaxID=1834167 RepID=A0ABZ2T0M9_9ENTE|nr:hypothetical protein [Enterococcus sp. 12C11_DIV0727]OTO69801.1 hypothetical protein A5866_002017 [Enterococcus sp. 12C11_DIV0727]
MNNEKYICPVCGFEGLELEAYNDFDEPSYEICPCCGFQFGFDDDNAEHDKNIEIDRWRNRWISEGCNWYSEVFEKPKDWNPKKQLEKLKLEK